MLTQIDDTLDTRELIKIRVHLESAPETPKELAQKLADPLGAEVIQVIGGIIVLYREIDEERSAEKKKKRGSGTAKATAKKKVKIKGKRQRQREKEAKKNQRVVDIKEIRLSLNIDVHDFNTKLNHAKKFIKNGDKVKVSIRFRGREMGHPELGYDTMNKFADAISEVANVEKAAKLEGRNMLMFLAPKPNK